LNDHGRAENDAGGRIEDQTLERGLGKTGRGKEQKMMTRIAEPRWCWHVLVNAGSGEGEEGNKEKMFAGSHHQQHNR